MENETVLVIGASGGIGTAIAKKLSEEGKRIIMVGRNRETMEKVKEELLTESFIISYDLMDLDNTETIFQIIAEKNLKLDGMVFCAGINRDMPVKINDVSMMLETMTINSMSFVELSKHFIKKKYSKDGASIVAISSNATRIISAGMCTYTASKAALEAEVSVLSKEIAKRKQRVNCISPACVDTEMIADAPFLSNESIEANQPLGIIPPEAVAELTSFLLSEKSSYITGVAIPITAGA